MLKEEEILFSLDNYRNGYDPAFVQLGHPYMHPIDSRINVFRSNQGEWALAIETFGYCDRAGAPELKITYYGDCLINLDKNKGYDSDYYSNSYLVYPIDEDSFSKTLDEYGSLKSDAKNWIVRGLELALSYSKDEYSKAGIELKEYNPNEICIEEVCRLLATKYRDIFRATDDELYKSIPRALSKILVIDEWYHRDFYQDHFDISQTPAFVNHSTEAWLSTLEDEKDKLAEMNILPESLVDAFNIEKYNLKRDENNQREWQSNRPGSYETWQLISKVLAVGDVSLYKPALKPNSNWRNWPEAGTM